MTIVDYWYLVFRSSPAEAIWYGLTGVTSMPSDALLLWLMQIVMIAAEIAARSRIQFRDTRPNVILNLAFVASALSAMYFVSSTYTLSTVFKFGTPAGYTFLSVLMWTLSAVILVGFLSTAWSIAKRRNGVMPANWKIRSATILLTAGCMVSVLAANLWLFSQS